MTESEIKAWINDQNNLDKAIGKFFSEQPKTAIFMAGIPGAGKTEFVEELKLNPLFKKFIVIEHDKLVEYLPDYKPENYYDYRSAGSRMVNHVFKKCLSCGHSFIFDGTLAHDAGLDNIRKSLRSGYAVWVAYIVLDSDKAWDATQKRERLFSRGIKMEGFKKTCGSINSKLLEIFDKCTPNDKFRFMYLDKKDSIKDSRSHEMLYSTDPEQALLIRERLEKNYNDN